MQVSVEEKGALRRSLTITVPKEIIDPKLEAAYRKLKSEVTLKGFRKGKVPQKVLERTYGEKVKNEVAEAVIQDTYFDALEDVKLDAVVHPDIRTFDYKDDGSFEYEAEIDIKPVFELKDYKGVEVEHPELSVSDYEIQKTMEITRKEMAPLQSVDRGAQQDDLVIIDFQGYQNGEEMSQVKGSEYPVDIGSGRNGKEFEEMLLGLKKGEDSEKVVEFPGEFPNPILAGKTVTFKLSVKDVKERVLPEINDEFAQDVSEQFKTLDDLKAHITDKIRKEKERTMDGDISDKIMAKLLDAHGFDLPGRLVAYEINELIKEMENNLDQQGLTLESAGLNRDKLAEHYKETAEKRVRGDFILKKIAEVEEIKLSDEDINTGFNRISEQYGMPVDEVRKYFQNRNDMLPFMNELLTEKILEFLRAEANIKFIPAEQADASTKDETATAAQGE